MVVVRNIQGLVAQQSQHSFEELIKQKKDKIVRDSFVLLSPDGDGSDSLTAGYTVIYPGCRTAGHSHEEYEELYHIVRGKGKMQVGDDRLAVEAGDTFVVPFGLFHATSNSDSGPLEYFWVLAPKYRREGTDEQQNRGR